MYRYSFIVHLNSVDHADGRSTNKSKTDKLRALLGLVGLLVVSFGCCKDAEARKANWEETSAYREMEIRDRYVFWSSRNVPSIKRFFQFENRNFDWDTYQDLRTRGQTPRYMMRPPTGLFEHKQTP